MINFFYLGICHTCGNKVTGAGQACQAMGNLYHTNCFICCACGRALRGKAFYNVYGRVYCEEDYMVFIFYNLINILFNILLFTWNNYDSFTYFFNCYTIFNIQF